MPVYSNETPVSYVRADWDITKVRSYLIDYDGGDDSNVGYVDAAVGATLTPAGLALKTWQRFREIFPLNGDGRMCQILVKNRAAGATYKDRDGNDDDLDLEGFDGYRYLLVRGSTDLTDSSTDQVRCGAITAIEGPGTGGVWTVDSVSTREITVASGTLPAEGWNGPNGLRIRMTTGAAAGKVCTIIRSLTTSTLTFAQTGDLSGIAAGDEFLIERPGVRFRNGRISGPTALKPGFTGSTLNVAGFGFVGTGAESWDDVVVSDLSQGSITFAEFLNTSAAVNFYARNCLQFSVNNYYSNASNTSIVVGMGLRLAGTAHVTNCMTAYLSVLSAFRTVSNFSFFTCPNFQIGTHSGYLVAGVTVVGSGGAGVPDDDNVSDGYNVIGNTGSTTEPLHIASGIASGAVQIENSHAHVKRVNIVAGAGDGVVVKGVGNNVAINELTGTVTGDGIDLSGAKFANVSLGRITANTITGAAEIRNSDGTTTTHAAVTASATVIDSGRGTRIIGAGVP